MASPHELVLNGVWVIVSHHVPCWIGAQICLTGPWPTTHDRILIIDFGSQLTQLIARRVREAGVYCEIAPFQSAGEALKRLNPKRRHPVGWTGLHRRHRQPARAAGGVFQSGLAGAGHLLWPDDHVRAAGR
jgi:hypothetical protein